MTRFFGSSPTQEKLLLKEKKTALALGVTLFIFDGTVKRTISHISNLQQPAVKLESESYVTTASRRLFIDSGNFFHTSLGMC